MNARRVAGLLRELADAIEGDDDGAVIPSEEPFTPRPRRAAPAKPRLVRPEGENDELARRKARTFLRTNGYTKTDR